MATVVIGGAGLAHALRSADPGPAASADVMGVQLVKAKPGDQAAKDFSVSGQVDGLFPGGTRPLFLALANPNNGAISATALTVAVSGVPGCPSTVVQVGPLGDPAVVPGNGTAMATLSVHMASGAPDAAGSPSPSSGALSLGVDVVAPTVTVTLSNGGGNSRVTAQGTAGTSSTDVAAVALTICKNAACPGGTTVLTAASLPVSGGGTWGGDSAATSGNNNGSGSYYATATQNDVAGNTGTGNAGPFAR